MYIDTNRVFRIHIKKIFPSLNEVLTVRSADKKHGWSALKKKCQMAVKRAAWGKAKALDKHPYRIVLTWMEWNTKRDVDNISGGGTKPILDALRSMKVIGDDDWSWVQKIEHIFMVATSEDDAGVVVEIFLDKDADELYQINKTLSRKTNVPIGKRIAVPTKKRRKKGVKTLASRWTQKKK